MIISVSKILCRRKTKQDDYANLTGGAFETIKNEIRKQINEISVKKALLESKRLTNLSPETRADSNIKELRKFPDEEVFKITTSEICLDR